MKGDLVLRARSVFRGEDLFEDGRKSVGYHKKGQEEDIQVCLNCSRPNCCGEVKCFRKRKKEMEKGAID